jgi:hypothetical protein
MIGYMPLQYAKCPLANPLELVSKGWAKLWRF